MICFETNHFFANHTFIDIQNTQTKNLENGGFKVGKRFTPTRVTRCVWESVAQNVAQSFFVKIDALLLLCKSSQKCGLLVYIKKNLASGNNRPTCKNSRNLVSALVCFGILVFLFHFKGVKWTPSQLVNPVPGIPLAVRLDERTVCIPPGRPGRDGHGQAVRVVSPAVARLPMAPPLAAHRFRALRPAGTLCPDTHPGSGDAQDSNNVRFRIRFRALTRLALLSV
jgi:hypothetical protein